jgi:hypothetical protein
MPTRPLLAMLLVAAHLYPKDARNWKQGAVLDIDAKGVSRQNFKLITYRIQGDGEICAGQEIAKKSAAGVRINRPVEYAIENRNLYIRDARGKTHKLTLTTNCAP